MESDDECYIILMAFLLLKKRKSNKKESDMTRPFQEDVFLPVDRQDEFINKIGTLLSLFVWNIQKIHQFVDDVAQETKEHILTGEELQQKKYSPGVVAKWVNLDFSSIYDPTFHYPEQVGATVRDSNPQQGLSVSSLEDVVPFAVQMQYLPHRSSGSVQLPLVSNFFG